MIVEVYCEFRRVLEYLNYYQTRVSSLIIQGRLWCNPAFHYGFILLYVSNPIIS